MCARGALSTIPFYVREPQSATQRLLLGALLGTAPGRCALPACQRGRPLRKHVDDDIMHEGVFLTGKNARSETRAGRIGVPVEWLAGGVSVALTREQVEHVAELAKLRLTAQETSLFQEQLSDILDYVAQLDELDTAAIPPTAAVLPLRNVTRSDVSRPSFPREAMLANAPTTEDGFVKVQAVLDSE